MDDAEGQRHPAGCLPIRRRLEMAEITPALVKELREMTGAGFTDCKKALAETDGDIQKAAEALQIKKKAKAAKKSGRIAAEGRVASYIHLGGRIGVLVEVNCETDFAAKSAKFGELVEDICLHIAAKAPAVVRPDDLPDETVATQKAIFIAQVIDEGKPEKLAERIVEGKLAKWKQEQALLDQEFVKDDAKTVAEHVAEISGEIGERIDVRRFVRYELGEGLEKRKYDIAAEVAEQLGR